MSGAISIISAFENLQKLKGRTPHTSDEDFSKSFKSLSDYRNGSIFVTYYDGNSEWEVHPNGDEFVNVIEGETTLFLLQNDIETANKLKAGEFIVVPQNVWHRFETPVGVKVLTITPQPTTHSVERPNNT